MDRNVILNEFMSLELKDRNAIFELYYNAVPSIEARAELLKSLPREESIRIIESINNSGFDYCLESILKSGGKKYLLDLFPSLSSSKIANILFSSYSDTYWGDSFNFLPIRTIVELIDWSIEFESHQNRHLWYIFNSIKFITKTEDSIALKILNEISKDSVKHMISYRADVDQEKLMLLISICSSEKIAEVCNTLTVRQAYKIVYLIDDSEKRDKTITFLSQKTRNYFFTKSIKSNGKKLNLIESDVILKNLPLESKKQFVKKFPESEQIKDLSLVEKIECFCL